MLLAKGRLVKLKVYQIWFFKKNKLMKNKLILGIAMIGLGAFASASFAGAQMGVTSTIKEAVKPLFNQKVEIGGEGQAQIRGVVVGTSANAIMVKSWGGIWTSEVSSGTMISAQGGKADWTQVKSGDEVAIHGKVVENKSLTISAKLIKDYSLKLNTDNKIEVKDKDVKKNIEKRQVINNAKKVVAEKVKNFQQKIRGDKKVEGSITVSGNVICLPKKNPGEMQTLECAFGISSEGKNYGLRTEDHMNIEVGKTTTITGKLIKVGVDEIYDIVGIIKF